jgi:predicted heme/steroid binding protein
MKDLNWWILKIYRFSAFVLLVSLVLYIVSGYGMTKGLLDDGASKWLHLNLLPIIIAVAFTGHVSIAMRITMMRLKIWNKVTAAMLILVFALFLGGFIYIEYFYNPVNANGRAAQRQSQNIEKTVVLDDSSAEKVFTAEELAQYNGLNGMPAYAAIDGIVYDLSGVFTDGMHNGIPAGQDNTEAFYIKHMKEILLKHPVVGKLTE